MYEGTSLHYVLRHIEGMQFHVLRNDSEHRLYDMTLISVGEEHHGHICLSIAIEQHLHERIYNYPDIFL